VPNGRIGDNPLSDILIWGKRPFAPEINALIREIHAMSGASEAFDDDDLTTLLFRAEEDPALQPLLRERLLELRGRLS
jgi:hypothetical protein